MAKQADTGVYQLKDGNWGYRFKVCINGKAIYKKCSKDENGNLFSSKRVAIEARKRAIKEQKQSAEKRMATANASQSKTYGDVYREYCENGRKDRAYNTRKKQDSLWENHLEQRFGKRELTAVSTGEIRDYLTMLYYDNDYSFMYVESFLKMFYLILGQAYSRGYLETSEYNRLCVNKDTKIRMPKKKVDEDEDIRIFTEDELAIMDEYFKGTNAETAYMLGRYCGLRINECFGLKWKQIDTKCGTIRIEQQEQYQDGLIKLVPLKTRNARRTIYMCDKVKAYFARLEAQHKAFTPEQEEIRQQNQWFIFDGDGKKISSLELVNTLPNGKIQTVNSMKYHSRLLKQKYHIDFKFHFLRHTYGTHLATLNTPTHILCQQMGHGKIETTKKYYIGVSQKGVDTLLQNLNKM